MYFILKGGGQKGRNKHCKLIMLIINTLCFFKFDDTVLARIQFIVVFGIVWVVVVVGTAMVILHLVGIRIPMSLPPFSLVQGYAYGHSAVFMFNVRLLIRSLPV